MQLHCQTCHSPLRAEDVRLDIAVAKCHVCDAVFDLSARKDPGQPAVPARPKLVRAKAVVPPRFQVDEQESRTRVSWRWFTARHVLMLAFCIAFDGVLLFWFGPALKAKNLLSPAEYVPLLYVCMAVVITYTTLAGLLNSTEIVVDRVRITLRHGPLPWPGSRTLLWRSLAQLYVEEIINRSKNGNSVQYHLLAMDRKGRKVKLLANLDEKDQALYLEQLLERWLGIEDAPVDGEVAVRTQVV